MKIHFYVKLFLFSMKKSLIGGTEWNTSLPWVSLKIACLLKILGYVYTLNLMYNIFNPEARRTLLSLAEWTRKKIS